MLIIKKKEKGWVGRERGGGKRGCVEKGKGILLKSTGHLTSVFSGPHPCVFLVEVLVPMTFLSLPAATLLFILLQKSCLIIKPFRNHYSKGN